MKLVGLTGGIACGKSTVSRLLAAEGLPIIDSDVIARQVVQKGRWGHRRVVKEFGEGVLGPDGELNREALGAVVFSDAAARRRLNAATHLPVFLEILRQMLWNWLCCRPVVVIDMPLLFETGFYKVTSPRVLVACGADAQLRRLVARDGMALADAEARVASQMPLSQKQRLADIVLDNEGSLEALQRQVEALAARLRRRSWLHSLLLSPLGLVAILAIVWMRFSGH